ncbi:MAG: hypothetical protein OHK0057_32600 [Thermoflexibacter sp.]
MSRSFFLQENGKYIEAGIYDDTDMITTLTLPQLSIDLKKVFADAV